MIKIIDNKTIIEKIKQSKNYSIVHDDLIETIVTIESKKFKSQKDILKSSKSKLHQIFSSYKNSSKKDIEQVEYEIVNAKNIKEIDFSNLLTKHVSTAERISIYPEFYSNIFSITGKPSKILDIACGLNPISYFSQIDQSTETYLGLDIDKENISLLNTFSNKFGLPLKGILCDVVHQEIPDNDFDVCFVLKFLTVLESLKKNSSSDFLKSLKSEFIVVSFPLKSISGKQKGMYENYSISFQNIIKNNFKILDEHKYKNELVYIIMGV